MNMKTCQSYFLMILGPEWFSVMFICGIIKVYKVDNSIKLVSCMLSKYFGEH